MSFDSSKLAPAPWRYSESHPRDVTLKRRHWQIGVGPPGEGGAGLALAFGEDDTTAAFIALARNAFDVMVRRGEGFSLCQTDAGGWMIDGPKGWIPGIHPDPFTALVEADRWYREHVEQAQPRKEPS